MRLSFGMKGLVVYGYLAEFLLAVLVLLFLYLVGWSEIVDEFFEQSAGGWATFFGVMLAGAMAALQVLFNLSNSEVGAWLEWKKLGRSFSGVFIFSLVLFLVATVTSLAVVYIHNAWLTRLGVVLWVLGLINSFNFSVFRYQLSRLPAVFNLEMKKIAEAQKQSSPG